MAVVVLPYNPKGTDTKSIEGVMNDFSAITAQVNGNLDSTNMSAAFLASVTGATRFTPVTTAVNMTAAAGQAISVTGNATITLPAHLSGQMVAVTNQNGSTITIAGTQIYGKGLNSASSFPLSHTVGASVTLLDDGVNWYIISGVQDSGWQAMSLRNCAAASGAYVPAYRILGDKVELCGQAVGTMGGSPLQGGPSSLGNALAIGLPEPQLNAIMNGWIATFGAVKGTAASLEVVWTNNFLTLADTNSYFYNGQTISFDGLSYRLS